MNRSALIASMLVVLGACTTPPVSPVPERPRQLSEPTVRAESPLKVRWEQVSLTPTSARLVAHVERVNALPVPLMMRVEAPAGVTLEQGRAKVELPANDAATDVTETFTLSFTKLPETDLVLLVDGDNQAMGFHYKAVYRFGRAEPVEQPPAATGPALYRGGKSFGNSVPLSQ